MSKGSFVSVYGDNGNSLPHIKNTVGLISVNELCKSECAEELFALLEKTPYAVIKVNSYSISDFAVSPASLTVYDKDGNDVGTFEFSAAGDIITADNIYIYNQNNDCNAMVTSLGFDFLKSVLLYTLIAAIPITLAAFSSDAGRRTSDTQSLDHEKSRYRCYAVSALFFRKTIYKRGSA